MTTRLAPVIGAAAGALLSGLLIGHVTGQPDQPMVPRADVLHLVEQGQAQAVRAERVRSAQALIDQHAATYCPRCILTITTFRPDRTFDTVDVFPDGTRQTEQAGAWVPRQTTSNTNRKATS